MKRYTQILKAMNGSVWCITEEMLKTILEIVDAHVMGTEASNEEIRMRLLAAHSQNGDREGFVRSAGGIGIIPLYGPMFPKANLMTEMSGATSLEQWGQDFRTMVRDTSIKSIIMDIDSPGGMHSMVPELADEIYAARDVKPIVAYANPDAHSAAYYLATQAAQVIAPPQSGSVGSVGTYGIHQDISRRLEMEGIKRTIIKAGEHKAELDESIPLSAEARAHAQQEIDACYGEFVGHVARGRGVSTDEVISNYGGGRAVRASDALELGMIDGFGTLDTVVGDLVESGGNFASFTSRMAARSSYDADKEHSEPGTGQGGEPTPREPPETGDKAIEGGWRRQTPPIVAELEEEDSSIMNREQLTALAQSLGIEVSDSMTDDELSAKIIEGVDDIVVPLVKASTEATKAKSFRTDYPEEYERMIRLESSDRSAAARSFADQFKTGLKDADGKETTKGFSALVLEKVEDVHVKIATGDMTHEDLTELLSSVNSGVVDYGEAGSSRQRDTEGQTKPQGNVREVRQQFADAVKNRMEEDGLERDAAIKLVGEENPELAEAYLNTR